MLNRIICAIIGGYPVGHTLNELNSFSPIRKYSIHCVTNYVNNTHRIYCCCCWWFYISFKKVIIAMAEFSFG